jgi:hypothetical protein
MDRGRAAEKTSGIVAEIKRRGMWESQQAAGATAGGTGEAVAFLGSVPERHSRVRVAQGNSLKPSLNSNGSTGVWQRRRGLSQAVG